MKYIATITLFLTLQTFTSYAAQQDYPLGTPSGSSQVSSQTFNYLSPSVPLTDKEKKALKLSSDWSKGSIDPVLSGGGKIVYVHGASQPTIIAAPMQVCDIEFQQGEKFNELIIGDSARWLMEVGNVGENATATPHLFVKPLDAGLETTAIVTTDRRVYHLRFISQTKGHTPYVGFTYADEMRQKFSQEIAEKRKAKEWNSTPVEGQNVDLSALNFNYDVRGKASWKPERVYDDGQQTFIRLPNSAKSGEMPVLLVRKGGSDVLVNYRVSDSSMIVDGVFDQVILILGVGSAQEKIDIRRK